MKKLTPQGINGFTLIELLVVVLIIGILAAIALPQYELAVEKTRMSEAVSTVKALMTASDRYFLATGTGPANISQLDITLPNSTTKYFYYGANTDAGGRRGWAQRLPSGSTYYIYMSESVPGRIMCWMGSNYTPTDVQRKLCNNLNSSGIL